MITDESLNTPRWFSQLNWTHSFLVASLHASGLLAFWYWPRRVDLVLFLGLYFITTFAIGIGYHRLLTHRGFASPRWLRRILAWAGAAALQGGPARWAAIHRRHHQMADKGGDPHSPLMGFFHAHVGWVVKKDAKEGCDYRELVPDVSAQDPWLRVLDYKVLFVFPWLLTGVICFAIAGWRGVLWGTVIRTLTLWHLTWCINSVCHVLGTRPNETKDESRNVWWLGLLTLGEGWHNNHHARPAAAIHGWRWYEVDISGYTIRLLARLGVIRKVVREPRGGIRGVQSTGA
ncbi:MAG TPA: fatty acid desaturase [Pyrinomonadaceae bacterium]|nr:fatty acid desaturase [Pyrinomonadaceae bacterium]